MKMNEKNIPGSKEISILIWAILQPAIAGGMPEKRAEEIYYDIMSSITELGALDDGTTAFEALLKDLIFNAVPEFRKSYGIDTRNEDEKLQ